MKRAPLIAASVPLLLAAHTGISLESVLSLILFVAVVALIGTLAIKVLVRTFVLRTRRERKDMIKLIEALFSPRQR